MAKGSLRLGVGALVLLAVVVLAPGTWLGPTRFSAWATGVQAVGVLVALALGGLTLIGDSRDRRTDRVLGLHRELTSDELGEARFRLSQHLRALGGDRPKRVSVWELRKDSENQYPEPSDRSASEDLSLLLRYFERANAAVESGSVDEALFVRLVGRHAVWWNGVVLDETSGKPVGPQLEELRALAEWSDEAAKRYPVRSWGRMRAHDFPAGTLP